MVGEERLVSNLARVGARRMAKRPIADRWIRVDESTMTIRVAEILAEIRFRVVARDPTLAEELLELPPIRFI